MFSRVQVYKLFVNLCDLCSKISIMALISKIKYCQAFFILLLLMVSFVVKSQDDGYYSSRFIRNDNSVYRSNIQTVLLYKEGFELSPPIIELVSAEKLVLSFDDLDADYKQYRYTFIHCDAFWNKSDLQPMEYLNGYFDDFIEDYKYSFNTTVPYVNYVVTFPNEDIRITKSGNYILKVYLDSDDDKNVVLTRRFMVYEPQVSVEARIANTVDLDLRYTHHQVSFRILGGNYYMTDTYRNLHVVVLQNGRWDNMIKNVQPRNIIGNEFNYSLVEELVFPAGNEYRYLDMKTLKYNTDRMQSLQYTYDGYQVYIMPDVVRAGKNYLYEEDINGRRLISTNDVQDPYTEGDYAWVHFLLPYYPPSPEGNIYIFGALTDYQFSPSNLMKYNYDTKAYEGKLLLKQGYYNYAYAFLPNNTQVADLGFIEGNYWETRNEYSILVYYRQVGDFYDRLIGIGYAISGDSR
jgi:hypothetical protein